MTDLPIYPKSSRTGVRGVNIVSRIINENLGWVFRETHNEHDFGIDGYLDVVNDNGEVTGQQFAVQVKYGEDYIKDQNPFGITYRGEKKHLSLHSPSGVSFEVKIACIRALDKDFLPQAAPAVAQTAGSGRIRPRSRCFLAQGRRFSAQRTDLSSRFRSV